jgi:hypothetical protein
LRNASECTKHPNQTTSVAVQNGQRDPHADELDHENGQNDLVDQCFELALLVLATSSLNAFSMAGITVCSRVITDRFRVNQSATDRVMLYM